MIFRTKGIHRLPALRLRVMHGAVTCLVRFQGPASRPGRAGVLAVIASRRAPFLRRWRLYPRPIQPPPSDAPRVA